MAIKYLKKYDLIKNKQVDHVHDEVTLISNMKHPNIVSFDGFTQDDCYLYLVMEFVQGGEFFIYLRSVGKLKPLDASFYGAQVAQIFEYMHSMNIVYRDLKPENLLINADGYLKLTDFGFAKVVLNRTYTLCGTPEYIAPEILLNKGHGKPVDWWALGILIYEMNNGIDPFTADDPMQIYQNILSGKIKFSSSFDPDAKSLVRHLVEHDLSKRYGNLKNGVDDIKKHRYFKQIDWKLLF